MKENYSKAYKEIVEILKYVSNEDIEKIPKEMRKMFEEKMDKNYEFYIDTDRTFEEQILLEETEAILSNLFRDYWATPYQKEKIIAKQNYDRIKLEEIKREKYNPDNIFKRKEKVEEDNRLLVINETRWYKKIYNYFRSIFSK